jgi:hypothetical protein
MQTANCYNSMLPLTRRPVRGGRLSAFSPLVRRRWPWPCPHPLSSRSLSQAGRLHWFLAGCLAAKYSYASCSEVKISVPSFTANYPGLGVGGQHLDPRRSVESAAHVCVVRRIPCRSRKERRHMCSNRRTRSQGCYPFVRQIPASQHRTDALVLQIAASSSNHVAVFTLSDSSVEHWKVLSSWHVTWSVTSIELRQGL